MLPPLLEVQLPLMRLVSSGRRSTVPPRLYVHARFGRDTQASSHANRDPLGGPDDCEGQLVAVVEARPRRWQRPDYAEQAKVNSSAPSVGMAMVRAARDRAARSEAQETLRRLRDPG